MQSVFGVFAYLTVTTIRNRFAGMAKQIRNPRYALALLFGAGLTAREIGVVIGKTEDATQKLISRAIARLREVAHDQF